jgi:hypothetical protein
VILYPCTCKRFPQSPTPVFHKIHSTFTTSPLTGSEKT